MAGLQDQPDWVNKTVNTITAQRFSVTPITETFAGQYTVPVDLTLFSSVYLKVQLNTATSGIGYQWSVAGVGSTSPIYLVNGSTVSKTFDLNLKVQGDTLNIFFVTGHVGGASRIDMAMSTLAIPADIYGQAVPFHSNNTQAFTANVAVLVGQLESNGEQTFVNLIVTGAANKAFLLAGIVDSSGNSTQLNLITADKLTADGAGNNEYTGIVVMPRGTFDLYVQPTVTAAYTILVSTLPGIS